MTVLAQLLIAATLAATAVIYGTDVLAAIVLRPALAHVMTAQATMIRTSRP